MIKLVSELPESGVKSAELTRIKCLYDCYKDDRNVYFWVQDETKALISLADGNMTVYNAAADITELSEFITVMSPDSVFSDYDTLVKLCLPALRLSVMYSYCDSKGEDIGDSLSSREIYDLLDAEGFDMPEYPFFAVDFCRRLNHGGAQYYAVSGKCAAVSFNSGKYALLNGIVSRQKGMGSVALEAIKQKNYGRGLFACCRENFTEFYEKNGLKKLYDAGYWVKTNEHK